jgi:uncharacterized protein (DUF1501 family)
VSSTAASYRNLLVLIELSGGNDGLNTVVPYADPAYYALRPKIAIARDDVVQLSDRAGLHPALAPLEPLWRSKELAVLQGIGYPAPNLSHFRSIEIWDTASSSDAYLTDGWLTRAFAAAPAPRAFAADGIVIGSNAMGPLAGSGTARGRAVEYRQFSAAGPPRGAGRRAAQPRLPPHPDRRGGHRAGSDEARHSPRVRDRVSARRLRQRDQDRLPGHREPVPALPSSG